MIKLAGRKTKWNMNFRHELWAQKSKGKTREKWSKELNERTQKEVNKTKMLVPENQPPPKHVVSMFLATGGAGGHLLGSDEKEIIYLVFGIIDLQNKEVSDQTTKYSERSARSIREIPEKHVFGQSRWIRVMERRRLKTEYINKENHPKKKLGHRRKK